MQFKMPSPRWMLVVLLLVPAGWLLIWLLFSLITRSPVGSASELSGLLAALGGIMGAVFTVGGLILALVAVLSQITLEDRAKRVMEDKFNELAPTLEDRADRRIAGRIAYRDTLQDLKDHHWSEAEMHAKEALDLYPDLPHVQSTVALNMADDVVGWFFEQIVGQFTVLANQLPDYGRVEVRVQRPEPPTTRAIECLNAAQTSGDDPEGRVSAAQALLYGITCSYDQMLEAVKRALQADKASKSTRNKDSLTIPERLLMLVYACDNEKYRLQRLSEALNIDMPVPISAVEQSLNAIGSDPFIDHVIWYAAVIPLGQKPPRLGAAVWIFKRDDKDRGQVAKAHIFQRGAQVRPIPLNQEEVRSVSDLMSELDDQFMFICQTQSTT